MRGRCLHPRATEISLCKATEISLLPVLEARDLSQDVSRATLPPRLNGKPLPPLPALWGSSAQRQLFIPPLSSPSQHSQMWVPPDISAKASQTSVEIMTTKARQQGCPLGQCPQLVGTLGLGAMKELPPAGPQTLCHHAPNCLWCPFCIRVNF